ncbi:hypothetical protein MTO96_043468 [Rhipicephalus appendiculatus]
MDTTCRAAAADEKAHEIARLFVELEGLRGYFSGCLIDYRMPCTASEDTSCQIVASIPLWNEFLFWLELELRELPWRRGGNLELCTSLTFVMRCPQIPDGMRPPHCCSGS